MYCLFQNEDINVRRDCVLRCLSIYLNEDLDSLIKEYVVSILSFCLLCQMFSSKVCLIKSGVHEYGMDMRSH